MFRRMMWCLESRLTGGYQALLSSTWDGLRLQRRRGRYFIRNTWVCRERKSPCRPTKRACVVFHNHVRPHP